MDALDALATRASPPGLTEPAPDAVALDRMLRAGARAPDHGRLRPWQFILVEGAARNRLGDVLADALVRREPGIPQAAIDKERSKPMRAPLLIIVAARLREHRGVPGVEQVVAAGAAAQNILLAAHALGFGAFWRTGAAAYDDSVKNALGLRATDAIVGFLYVGTPTAPAAPVGVSDVGAHVLRWNGPVGGT